MRLIISTFEGTVQLKQKNEYVPLKTKLPTGAIAGTDDEKYLKRYQDKLLKKTEQLKLERIE